MGWFDIHPHNGLRNIFPCGFQLGWFGIYPHSGPQPTAHILSRPGKSEPPSLSKLSFSVFQKGIPGWLGKYKDWLNQIVANSNLGHLEEVVCNYSHQSANAGFDLRLILSADIANCTESLRTCFRIWQSNNIFFNHVVMKYIFWNSLSINLCLMIFVGTHL